MGGMAVQRTATNELTATGERRDGVPAGEATAKLYGLRGSGPTLAAELMLQHKGIDYRRVNLLAMLHRRRLPRKGFPGGTVPALVLDGRKVQTNRAIARALDELVPEPPLFPDDPEQRTQVEAAERFTDEVLQQATRRVLIWTLAEDPRGVRFHPANGRIYVPGNAWLRARVMPPAFELYGIDEEVVRRDFEALPSMLDRMDSYIAQGVIGSPRRNAADFEAAPLIGALMGIGDLGAEVGSRPVAELAQRLLPRW